MGGNWLTILSLSLSPSFLQIRRWSSQASSTASSNATRRGLEKSWLRSWRRCGKRSQVGEARCHFSFYDTGGNACSRWRRRRRWGETKFPTNDRYPPFSPSRSHLLYFIFIFIYSPFHLIKPDDQSLTYQMKKKIYPATSPPVIVLKLDLQVQIWLNSRGLCFNLDPLRLLSFLFPPPFPVSSRQGELVSFLAWENQKKKKRDRIYQLNWIEYQILSF